jgi:CBS domain-containing protein
MLVRECMSRHAITVSAGDSAWVAAELLTSVDLHRLPVVDGGRRVLGIVTELDLIRALRQGRNLYGLAVAEVMHTPPLTVSPEEDLDTAAALMDDERVHQLLVCLDGRLLGVLSRADVLRTLAFAQHRQRDAQPCTASSERTP